MHSLHEEAVDRRIPEYPFLTMAATARGRRREQGGSPGKLTKTYRELVRAYGRYGYNRNVHRITKRQLKRAANALAVLIVSLR